MHRCKDTHDDIRANVVRHLGLWLLADPVSILKDEYLKYLGWICSDTHTNTRFEAVAALDCIVEVGKQSMYVYVHVLSTVNTICAMYTICAICAMCDVIHSIFPRVDTSLKRDCKNC